jgi:hypothetical protein
MGSYALSLASRSGLGFQSLPTSARRFLWIVRVQRDPDAYQLRGKKQQTQADAC